MNLEKYLSFMTILDGIYTMGRKSIYEWTTNNFNGEKKH